MKKCYTTPRIVGLMLLIFFLKNPVFAQDPCNAWSNFPWHEWISGVQIGSNSNPSGKSIYSNFTQNTPFLMKIGEKTPVLFTTGFSYEAFDESWAVWIDIDHDGVFHPTDELAFVAVQDAPADGTPSFSTAGFIKLPGDALPGATRMRVAMRRGGDGAGNPCDVLNYGEIEDYTINVEPGTPGPGCQIKVNLVENWCIDTLPDTYRIGFQVVGSGSNWVTNFDKTDFKGQIGNVFFPEKNIAISGGEWLLTVRDSANLACKSSEKIVPPDPCQPGQNAFPAVDYCPAEASFPWHDWISGVKIGSFEQNSGKSTFSDFSQNNPIELAAGKDETIVLTAAFSYTTFSEFWKIWLDANQDGIFDDQKEVVFHGITAEPPIGTPAKTITGSLKTPADALSGLTRMRIIMQRGQFAGPCGGIHFGEVEDFLVNISPKTDIVAPGNAPFPVAAPGRPKSGQTLFSPNPANGSTTVFFEKKESGPIRIRLFDGTGRVVFSQKMTIDEGKQSLEIPLENLPKGLFFWQLEKDGASETGKLTVF